jgi:hypothetical protein
MCKRVTCSTDGSRSTQGHEAKEHGRSGPCHRFLPGVRPTSETFGILMRESPQHTDAPHTDKQVAIRRGALSAVSTHTGVTIFEVHAATLASLQLIPCIDHVIACEKQSFTQPVAVKNWPKSLGGQPDAPPTSKQAKPLLTGSASTGVSAALEVAQIVEPSLRGRLLQAEAAHNAHTWLLPRSCLLILRCVRSPAFGVTHSSNWYKYKLEDPSSSSRWILELEKHVRSFQPV